MEMTNAFNKSVMNYFNNYLLYQMLSRNASGYGHISNSSNETLLLYKAEYGKQNAQFPLTEDAGVGLNKDLSKYRRDESSKHPVTVSEQLKLITALYGFSKSELGKIFGVTRQSIYNWYNNDEPDPKHLKKIKCLADMVFNVDPQPSQEIFHVYANETIEGYDKSLFNYLLDDVLEKEKIEKLSSILYEMSKERWRRIDAMPKPRYVNHSIG